MPRPKTIRIYVAELKVWQDLADESTKVLTNRKYKILLREQGKTAKELNIYNKI